MNRVSELRSWRHTIAHTFHRIEREMKLLSEEKYSTEKEIAAMRIPFAIISECLTMRDCRLGSEITYDNADSEIKKELGILEDSQRLLSDKCQKAWEKLCRLEEVKFKLELEINNKIEAEELDLYQLSLDKRAANITFKVDATRNPGKYDSYAFIFQIVFTFIAFEIFEKK